MLPDEIETQRLKLRPLSFQDVDAIFAFRSDPEWGRYELFPRPYAPKNAEKFVAAMILRDQEIDRVWAIRLDGETIGTVGIMTGTDWKIASLGYGLHRRHWGRGLTSEAVHAVIGRAFETYGQLRRIRAQTDARNDRSSGLLRKLGFVHEGTLRANQLNNGEFVDEAIFGLLREEWRP